MRNGLPYKASFSHEHQQTERSSSDAKAQDRIPESLDPYIPNPIDAIAATSRKRQQVGSHEQGQAATGPREHPAAAVNAANAAIHKAAVVTSFIGCTT